MLKSERGIPRSQLRRRSRGAVLVYLLVVFGVLAGFGAMVIDWGIAEANRRMMVAAVDGAALAGALELAKADGENHCADAIARAYAYANGNGVTTAEIDAVTEPAFRIQCVNKFQSPNPDAIVVSAQRELQPTLISLVGGGPTTVVASAMGIASALEPSDLWPFGVDPLAYVLGDEVALQDGASPSQPGNFHSVDFDGTGGGGNDSKYWFRNGYSGYVPDPVDEAHPWIINSEPGNMAQLVDIADELIAESAKPEWAPYCSGEAPSLACPKVGLVPIIDPGWEASNCQGQCKNVAVVRFAAFELTRTDCPPDKKGGCGKGQKVIYGRFLKYVTGVGRARYGLPLGETSVTGVFLWR